MYIVLIIMCMSRCKFQPNTDLSCGQTAKLFVRQLPMSELLSMEDQVSIKEFFGGNNLNAHIILRDSLTLSGDEDRFTHYQVYGRPGNGGEFGMGLFQVCHLPQMVCRPYDKGGHVTFVYGDKGDQDLPWNLLGP